MRARLVAGLGIGAATLAAAGLSAASPAASVKLTVTIAGQGAVASVPKGIACPKTCSKAFTKGTKVKLTAKPMAGSAFARWTGACKGTKPACTVALTGAKKAGAVFAAAAPQGFTPQTLTGTWSGSWRNETFGSTGPASIVFTVAGATAFMFTATIGGNVFGCPPPAPVGGTVTQGTGPNTWSSTGFNVSVATASGGTAAFAYTYADGSMTGNGTSGCRPGLTWRMTSGTFTSTAFTGRIEIALNGSPLATSVLNLTRS